MSRESFERNIKKNYSSFEKIRIKDRDLVLDLISYIEAKAPKNKQKQYIEKVLSTIIAEEEKGNDAKKVIGKNYKSYGDSLMGITAGNKKIDFIDMAILTVAMIPFFLAINCLMGVNTLSYSVLESRSYSLTLAPIIATLLVMPMIYMLFYYLANSKKGYNKSNFAIFVVGEIIWIIVLNLVQAYFKNLIIVKIDGYAFLAIGSVIIILFYIIRINGFMKARLNR